MFVQSNFLPSASFRKLLCLVNPLVCPPTRTLQRSSPLFLLHIYADWFSRSDFLIISSFQLSTLPCGVRVLLLYLLESCIYRHWFTVNHILKQRLWCYPRQNFTPPDLSLSLGEEMRSLRCLSPSTTQIPLSKPTSRSAPDQSHQVNSSLYSSSIIMISMSIMHNAQTRLRVPETQSP